MVKLILSELALEDRNLKRKVVTVIEDWKLVKDRKTKFIFSREYRKGKFKLTAKGIIGDEPELVLSVNNPKMPKVEFYKDINVNKLIFPRKVYTLEDINEIANLLNEYNEAIPEIENNLW